MYQAVTRLEVDAPVRIDGIDVPRGLSGDALAVVKGDGKVPQIAAASIMAKVLRDRLMARLARRHTYYCWESNAGYGTRAHRDAIIAFGHTAHHRRSFGDLFALLSDGGERLIAHPAPDAECLDAVESVMDTDDLNALRRAG
jgi:ribonuclease HII